MSDEKIKIFVVGTSDVLRKILINHVSSAQDMEVVGEITSGQGSILMLEEVNPDVVLLDVGEREQTHLEDVVTQLKTLKPDVGIVICTDYHQVEHIEKAINRGASDFLTKPYMRNNVLRIIRECYTKANEI